MTAPWEESADELLDPDSARAYLRDWKNRVHRNAINAHAMSESLKDLRVTARDTNDLVEVTIDSSGVLLDVRFTERIQRVAPDVVSRAVMAALRSARQEATRRTQAIVVETMGAESVAGQVISRRLEQENLDG
jgi:DNA-binding protein YbaB